MSCMLTFDDGPKVPETGQILDILQKYQVKAIFFLVGQRVQEQPEVVWRIVAEGHEIGNHGFSHRRLPGLSDQEIRQEIVEAQVAIGQIIGKKPRYFRPPHGEYTMRVQEICAEEGLELMIWDAEARDWEDVGSEALIKTLISQVTNASIILLHDYSQTVQALPRMIEELRNKKLL